MDPYTLFKDIVYKLNINTNSYFCIVHFIYYFVLILIELSKTLLTIISLLYIIKYKNTICTNEYYLILYSTISFCLMMYVIYSKIGIIIQVCSTRYNDICKNCGYNKSNYSKSIQLTFLNLIIISISTIILFNIKKCNNFDYKLKVITSALLLYIIEFIIIITYQFIKLILYLMEKNEM